MTVPASTRATMPSRLVGALTAVGRRRSARRDAEFLDAVVDAELEFLRRLPVHLRARSVETLAVLVMLAQDHRYHAQGWISRAELRRRSLRAVDDLAAAREHCLT